MELLSLISLSLNLLKASFRHDVSSLLNILACICESKAILLYKLPSQDVNNMTLPSNPQTPFRFNQLSQASFSFMVHFPIQECVSIQLSSDSFSQIFSLFFFHVFDKFQEYKSTSLTFCRVTLNLGSSYASLQLDLGHAFLVGMHRNDASFFSADSIKRQP